MKNCIYLLLVVSTLSWAQDPAPRAWRRVASTAVADNTGAPAGEPPAGTGDTFPSQLTLQPGAYITVRTNEWLSSDRNQAGDAFTATLAQPVVVEGIVVAERGQTIGGRVVEAQKAGRVHGVSRLALRLTDLTLVDGQQMSLDSQLVTRTGPTSTGRDAAAIAGTTATGAAIGTAAAWGTGAAIGAMAGAAAGAAGVLLTRGRPTIIYPETTLTFRVEAPVAISTARAPQVFHYVQPDEYRQAEDLQARTPPSLQSRRRWHPPYGYPPPYPVLAPAPFFGPPIFFGPPLFFGPGLYYGRPFRRW